MRLDLAAWLVAMGLLSGSATATEELADISFLRVVLDDHGRLVDLSQLSRAEQHLVVREYWTGTPAELRLKRIALVAAQYEVGAISEDRYWSIVNPEPGYCEYGPANPPEGMTTERLDELLSETANLPPSARYALILAEPPVAPESDDVLVYPVIFSIPAHGDPVCLDQQEAQPSSG